MAELSGFENIKHSLGVVETGEIMTVPEIKSEAVPNFYWYTILHKMSDPNWERLSNQNECGRKIEDFFRRHQLDSELINRFRSISDHLDEEVLLWFSLALGDPDLEKAAVSDGIKYKEMDGELLEKHLKAFKGLMSDFQNRYHEVWALMQSYIDQDKRARQESKEEHVIVQESINYFKPKNSTTHLKEINFLPTNPILRRNSGSGFGTEEKAFIITANENTNSKRHEFLHFIVNPITEKINLTPEEQRKITDLASHNLIVEQGYGEDATSLLNEVLIRVYCNLKEGNKPVSFEEYQELLGHITEDEFNAAYASEERRGKFVDYGITNLRELKDKAGEVYNNEVRDVLAKNVYKFYLEFEDEKKKSSNLTFEDYFIKNYLSVLQI